MSASYSGTDARSSLTSTSAEGSTPSTATTAQTQQSYPQFRFQRRTSEKVLIEGAYREGGMDYSASAGYAGGSSPWASSPEASKSSFADTNQQGSQQTEDSQKSSADESGFNSQLSSQQAEGWSPEQANQSQWSAGRDTQAQPTQPEPQEDTRRREAAARYHNTANVSQPQQSRQPQPQYKLQLKITGLERTAKKDPILRFDAYVG